MTPRAPAGELFDPTHIAAPAFTRYAPDKAALASANRIRDEDVLTVIDARGGSAYLASVETGLANRGPFIAADERRRAVERALASGVVARTPTGRLHRASRDNE